MYEGKRGGIEGEGREERWGEGGIGEGGAITIAITTIAMLVSKPITPHPPQQYEAGKKGDASREKGAEPPSLLFLRFFWGEGVGR